MDGLVILSMERVWKPAENQKSATTLESHLGLRGVCNPAHLNCLHGAKMLVDFNEAVVTKYQNDRLGEKASPKTINEEVGFLLRILGEPGDLIRVRLRKKKTLKLKTREVIGKAYSEDEKSECSQKRQSPFAPHLPALTLALNAGMRDGEIKQLTWAQINFAKQYLAIGRTKTADGEAG